MHCLERLTTYGIFRPISFIFWQVHSLGQGVAFIGAFHELLLQFNICFGILCIPVWCPSLIYVNHGLWNLLRYVAWVTTKSGRRWRAQFTPAINAFTCVFIDTNVISPWLALLHHIWWLVNDLLHVWFGIQCILPPWFSLLSNSKFAYNMSEFTQAKFSRSY